MCAQCCDRDRHNFPSRLYAQLETFNLNLLPLSTDPFLSVIPHIGHFLICSISTIRNGLNPETSTARIKLKVSAPTRKKPKSTTEVWGLEFGGLECGDGGLGFGGLGFGVWGLWV